MPVKVSALLTVPCLCALLTGGGGCASVVTYRCSFPSAEGMTRPPPREMPPGIRHEVAYYADNSTLNLICHVPALDLFISPRNDVPIHETFWVLILPVWSWERQGGVGGTGFRVQLDLHPRDCGFAIRPNEIELRLTNSFIRPSGFYGPWPTEREQRALQAEVAASWADMSFADKLGLTSAAARKRQRVDEASSRYRGGDVWAHPHRETTDAVVMDDTNAWYRLSLEFKGAGPNPDQLLGIRMNGVTRNGQPCPIPEIPLRAVRYTLSYGIP